MRSLHMQVSDGAAASLLMTRREANRRGLPILAIFRSFSAVGVDPAIMGVGPAVAIPEAVRMAGLAIEDIDLFELNEAFASQVGLGMMLSSLAVPLGAYIVPWPTLSWFDWTPQRAKQV